MARGGYGHGSGVPLHERLRRSGSAPFAPREDTFATTPREPPRPPTADPSQDCPARHCWVTVPVDGPASRPGLLLEWRRVEKGRWEGRVAYAAELRPGRWATVEEWIPAELLAAQGPPTGRVGTANR